MKHYQLLSCMLNKLNLFQFIHILITRIMMNLKNFIHKKKSLLLKLLLLILASIVIYIGVRKISTHSIVIGHPSEIIVISPENSQDVIIIGDPNKVNVKPKKL